MTRATLGMVLGTIGSAIGFYVWTQRMSAEPGGAARHGHLPNTPVAG